MNKRLFGLILLIVVLWHPYYMGAWLKTKPAGNDALSISDDNIRLNNTAIEAALDQDHDFTTSGTQTGKHEVLTMQEESSAGASSTNELHVQAIDGGSGQPELAVTSEDGNELQITKDGDLHSSAGLTVDGTTTLTGAMTANGGITLGAGNDLIGSATSDITMNTNKFTVAGATGNTGVAGTLDVTGNIDPTTYETTNGGFLDEDNMASDSATKVASQQSIKAFAEANGYPAINGTPTAVFTKYFTGTLDADASTSVAHGITGIDNILHVSACVFNDNSSKYNVYDTNLDVGAGSDHGFQVAFDGTNVRIQSVGAFLQSNKYRIKIDYVL